MNKKLTTLSMILIFLLLHANIIAISEQLETGDTTPTSIKGIIYVDDDNTGGPWDGTPEHPYKHIHNGISNAEEGDTIFVFNGVYYESLTIDKKLKLIGENRNTTIIDGMYSEIIIHLTENHVKIMNFSVRNSMGNKHSAGLLIESSNNVIADCLIYRTKTGVYVNNARNNKIKNCVFNTNGGGIFLNYSSDNEITDCTLCHNGIGIHFESSTGNSIHSSYVHTNGIGVVFYNSSNNEIARSAVCDNNDNQGGIFLFRCAFIDLINSLVCHNGVGICMVNSSNVLIDRCSFLWNTHYAIILRTFSKEVTVVNSIITDNFRYGIHSRDSSCKIFDNNIYENWLYGLYSESSSCDARYNWWGFITGPALTNFGIADRITREPGKFLYFPWRKYSLKNVGAGWEIDEILTKKDRPIGLHKTIVFADKDTDSDGCPDWWETKYGYHPDHWDDHKNLDPDEDALNNVEECFTDKWGSNPFHRDVFLEFDWVEKRNPSRTNKPPSDLIESMKARFEEHDITLHVDVGNLGGGEEIPYVSNFSYADLRDLYWDYFLHNDLNNPRKGVFHYGLICDYGPGGGFVFIGWDNIDAFCISAQRLYDNHQSYSRETVMMYASMHELGHTFGLLADDYGGIDNRGSIYPRYMDFWRFSRYKSCMNYLYVYDILDYSDGSSGTKDFDDWSNLDFSFFKNTHLEWPKE